MNRLIAGDRHLSESFKALFNQSGIPDKLFSLFDNPDDYGKDSDCLNWIMYGIANFAAEDCLWKNKFVDRGAIKLIGHLLSIELEDEKLETTVWLLGNLISADESHLNEEDLTFLLNYLFPVF